MSLNRSKVFFLGASKMGTTSLHRSLKEAGCRALQAPVYALHSHRVRCPRQFFDRADYFLDGNFHHVPHLEQWFPGSRFVLLDRNPESWLVSLYNWIGRVDQRHMADDAGMARLAGLFANRGAMREILTVWLLYRSRVLSHFADNPRFLHVDLTRGDAEWQRLSNFLGVPLDPQWENSSREMVRPDWLPEVRERAQRDMTASHSDFPDLDQNRLRLRIYQFCMEILAERFFKERHLGRHLRKTLWQAHPEPVAALRHLWRFFTVVLALSLRFLVVPQKCQSPFLV